MLREFASATRVIATFVAKEECVRHIFHMHYKARCIFFRVLGRLCESDSESWQWRLHRWIMEGTVAWERNGTVPGFDLQLPSMSDFVTAKASD
jgi:hypothetical protein